MKILNAQQLKAADQAMITNEPIASIELMERAAYQCFRWIEERDIEDKNIHIFCGLGNNGGDGLAIARMLFDEAYEVKVYIIHYADSMSEDFVTNYQRAEEMGLQPENVHSKDDFPILDENDIVIDAIFGTGLNKPISGFTQELIESINASNSIVFSIDVPSGLYIDKPVVKNQSIIQSDICLTFHSPKLAFLLPENEKYVGGFIVFNIGLDMDFIDTLETNTHFITDLMILKFYRNRKRFAHKGNFGHALIIGGSFGKIGASLLTSKAALKIGAGLVTAYIPKCGYSVLQSAVPEVMVEVDAEEIIEHINYKSQPTVIGLGIGMGTADKTASALKTFLKENKLPLVIDADAINILAKNKSYLEFLPENSILTPHPKELERLIGPWKNDYEKLEMASAFSKIYNCILVIKGGHTVVIDKEQYYFNSSGNPGLATAGSGDVLTGIITGLLAQKYTALEAALFGVYIHGKAADIAIEFESLETILASDLFRFIPDAIKEMKHDFLKDNFMDVEEDIDKYLDDYFFDDEDDEADY